MSVASGMSRRKGWPERRRRSSARPRWLVRARALRDRYRHRRSAAGFVERVLLRRSARLHRVTERWMLAARATHPQIALTVRPLLRLRFAWTGSTSLVGPVAAPRAGAGVVTPGRPAASADVIRESWLTDRTLVLRAFAAGPSRPAPGARVFERARSPRLVLAAPKPPRSLELGGLASARAQKLRRREERGSGPVPARVVLRESAPSRAEAVQPPPVAFARAEPPPRQAFPPAAAADVAGLPAPQLQALTERVVQQIDRRLSAWRERSGLA
jgi:hypothetical protein